MNRLKFRKSKYLAKVFWRLPELRFTLKLLPPGCSVDQLCPVPGQLQSTVLTNAKVASDRDFPGGPVVENLPSNAGDTGSIPDRGTKPTCSRAHVPQLESLCATTTEPALHN